MLNSVSRYAIYGIVQLLVRLRLTAKRNGGTLRLTDERDGCRVCG